MSHTKSDGSNFFTSKSSHTCSTGSFPQQPQSSSPAEQTQVQCSARRFPLPATRTTALSAGSSTESWLFLFLLSCLDRFHGNVSPGGPTGPDGHGDNDPPERSLRKDGSLAQERSLRVSSSDDSISLQSCKEGRGMRKRK